MVEYNEAIEKAKQETPSSQPKIPSYVGECILKITENLSSKYNFVSYTFKDEMVSDAIEKCIESVEKYDITYRQNGSPNPFGYFSQIAWNCFIQRIQKEKKETYIKHKNFERAFFHEMENMDEMFNNEEHNKVIDDFETKAQKKPNNYAKHSNLDYSKNRKKKNEESPPSQPNSD